MLMLPPLAAATCTERKNVQILPVLECVLLLLLLPLGRRLESIQRGGLVAESSKHALAQRADLRLPRAQLGGEQPVPQRVRVRVVQATTPERWRECRHCDARDDALENSVTHALGRAPARLVICLSYPSHPTCLLRTRA
jgi:hypothetical protein